MDTSFATLDESIATSAYVPQDGLHHSRNSSSALTNPALGQLVNFSAKLDRAETRPAQRLDKILQRLPTGVILLDSRGIVADCNESALRMLEGAIQGAEWRQVIAQNFKPRSDDGHEISLCNGKRVGLLTRSLEDGSGQLIVLNDLTETRAMQQQLARHQRLSDMGKMISSLAHQIRTPLAAALLYTDSLEANFGQVPGVRKYTAKVLSRLQNIERQIRDMLFFVRGDTELNDRLSLPAFVEFMQKEIAEATPDAAARIQWTRNAKLDSAAGVIACHKDAIIGALINVIENALQASATDEVVQVQVQLHTETANQDCSELKIVIDDQGCGIEPDLLAKLELGFVTTKSSGTGLGLAIVRLVVDAHNAQFQLSPRAAGGTRAVITLPIQTAGGVV